MEIEEEGEPMDMIDDMLLDDAKEIVWKQRTPHNRDMYFRKLEEQVQSLIPGVAGIRVDGNYLNSDSREVHRLLKLNSSLRSQLADAKLSEERCLKEYQSERSKRKDLEKKFDDLDLKLAVSNRKLYVSIKDSQGMLDEAEGLNTELDIQQGAIHMRLEEAEEILDSKYAEVEYLRSQLEAFLNKKCGNDDTDQAVNEAEFLLQEVSEHTVMRQDTR